MRAAIYNQYLDTLGGGERYTVSFAKVLAELGWSVDIEWKDAEIKENLEKRFGVDMKNINIIPDVKRGDGYDLCFWVSDGSIPALKARKNFLHFQVPFHHIGGNNLLNKMKLMRVEEIICNSYFTKKFIDREYGVESIVVYPPVPAGIIKPKRKENIILSVSRFSQLKQSKHQDVLIDVFKKLVDGGLTGWRLILTGGIEVGVGDFIEKLESTSNGYPIEIIKSPDFKTLKELYGKSKIFWSAAGFGEDEEETPEKMEHFGITVVEAMSGGAIPVVYNAGGHKEIIDDNVNGFLWDNTKILEEVTLKLIKAESAYFRDILKKAKEKSKKYDLETFKEGILPLLK